MQFAAGFVEYLVTGCGALIWIMLLAGLKLADVTRANTQQVVLALPLLYVMGLLIDGLASMSVKPIKRWIRPARGTRLLTAFIALHSAELAREVQIRSTRDRVARGAAINILVVGTLSTIWPERLATLLATTTPPVRMYLAPSFAVLFAVAFIVWRRCEYYSYEFKLHACRAIDQKLAAAASGGNDVTSQALLHGEGVYPARSADPARGEAPPIAAAAP